MEVRVFPLRCVLFLKLFLHFPFQWKTYDPAFSKLEIWFRFVFVVLTFIVTVSTVCLVGWGQVLTGKDEATLCGCDHHRAGYGSFIHTLRLAIQQGGLMLVKVLCLPRRWHSKSDMVVFRKDFCTCNSHCRSLISK